MAYRWLKLYYEILEDPKMTTLPDFLFRRTIELFLLAGRNGDDGVLQPVAHMAWSLRIDEKRLVENLRSLEQIGVVAETEPGKWVVVNFAKRQAAEDSAERVRAFRERKKSEIIPETTMKRDSNANVTLRYTEIEKEQEKELRAEAEEILNSREEIQPPPAPAAAPSAFETGKYIGQFNTQVHEGQAQTILISAANLVAVPSNEIKRIETVRAMVSQYGKDRTSEALSSARSAWTSTPRKTGGGTYSVTNFGWVDWAQEYLSTGKPPWVRDSAPTKITVDPFESLTAALNRRQRETNA